MFFKHLIIEVVTSTVSKIITKNLSLKTAIREIAELFGIEFLQFQAKLLTLEGLFTYFFRKSTLRDRLWFFRLIVVIQIIIFTKIILNFILIRIYI